MPSALQGLLEGKPFMGVVLLVAVCGIVYIVYSTFFQERSRQKPCISDHFDNPSDPLSPSSASTGAATGPGLSAAAIKAATQGAQTDTSGIKGASTTSATDSPINAPNDSPVPYSGWTLPTGTPPSGTVPSANQSSAISSTLPNATVGDPSQSIAQQNDVQSTLDAIANFQVFAANTTPALYPEAVKQQVAETTSAIKDITVPLNTARLSPSSSTLTVAQLSALRDRIGATTKVLSQLPANQGGGATGGAMGGAMGGATGGGTSADAKATPLDVISLDTMKMLSTRIQATVLALTNLSSTEATITQRINKLSQLKSNLDDLITKVTSKAMDLKDVPIKPADADNFLKNLDDKTTPLPPLITMASGTHLPPLNNDASASSATAASAAALQGFTQAFQTLMSQVKFQMTYDPTIGQNAAVMARLHAVEDKLFAYANSSTPLPPAAFDVLKAELKVLGRLVKPDSNNPSSYSPLNYLPTVSTRLADDTGSTPDTPSEEQLMTASGIQGIQGTQGIQGPFLNPVIRPGLTDAQRAARGSAAAFDESTVGGYNYRDRSIEICRQIKAEYGDNATFGCIADPNSVSTDYSWKGNYLSVCNRIGDAWGSQAGDKYGCPPFDPSKKFRQS